MGTHIKRGLLHREGTTQRGDYIKRGLYEYGTIIRRDYGCTIHRKIERERKGE